MKPRTILVVDDDRSIRDTLVEHLSQIGYDGRGAASAEEALSQLSAIKPAVIITDVRMPGIDGLELLSTIVQRQPSVKVLVITAHEDMQTAIGAMKGGAVDYLVKPLDLEELEVAVQRCLEENPAAEPDRQESGFDVVGRDPKMIAIYKRIGAVSRTRTPVLIRGETGTGKELVARTIHNHSATASEPFVAINCAAVPETLLESEMFGHVRGAFTGATSDREGRFAQAGAGTLFLDEIGDVSLAFQAKLLRVLQEREYTPVGGARSRRTDARIIAATHRPLEQMVAAGSFREDLYFRLRVVELEVPALRERRGDIVPLARHLLAKAAKEMGREGARFSVNALRAIQAHDWPGNVRELENAILRALALAPGAIVTDHDLTPLAKRVATIGADDRSLNTLEREHVERVLLECEGNKRRAAKQLGVSRPRLDRLIEKHAIVVSSRRPT
jgi:two-component system NtrC family response regulator